MAREMILHTIHGSHLYGLAHANSDNDSYGVFIGNPDGISGRYGMDTAVSKGFAEQSIDAENNDIMLTHLSRFQSMVALGAPQALEALFSTQKTTAPEWAAYFNNLRPARDEARARYRRTIINFAFNLGGRHGRARERAEEPANRYKLARHALRLTLNLNDLMRCGVFNPTLSRADAEFISSLAEGYESQAFEGRLRTMVEDAQLGQLQL